MYGLSAIIIEEYNHYRIFQYENKKKYLERCYDEKDLKNYKIYVLFYVLVGYPVHKCLRIY